MRPAARARSAFSLVELSIVLVILGLLVGGVLSGQSLIHAAELRAITSDYKRYVTATYSFRDKYFALPGDMTNATSFWGTAAACPGDNAHPSTDAKTCNGDGNGLIYSGSTNSMENFRAWQQLGSAGMIEGTYTGVTGPTHPSESAVPRVNVPAGRIGNSGYGWNPVGNISAGDPNYYPGTYGNVIHFGAMGNANVFYPLIKAEDAWNVDTKMDDGLPNQGNVRSFINASTITPGCAAANDLNYAISSTGNLCSLIFITGI